MFSQRRHCRVEDVDLVAKNGFGLHMPGVRDLLAPGRRGLNMAPGILDYVAKDLCNEAKAPNIYHARFAHGDLGAKSGKGFYDWSKKSIDDVKAPRDRP